MADIVPLLCHVIYTFMHDPSAASLTPTLTSRKCKSRWRARHTLITATPPVDVAGRPAALVKAAAWVIHITRPSLSGDHWPVQGVPRRRHAFAAARCICYEKAGALDPDGVTVDHAALLTNLWHAAVHYLLSARLAYFFFFFKTVDTKALSRVSG